MDKLLLHVKDNAFNCWCLPLMTLSLYDGGGFQLLVSLTSYNWGQEYRNCWRGGIPVAQFPINEQHHPIICLTLSV